MKYLFIPSFIFAGFYYSAGSYWYWSWGLHWLCLLILLVSFIGIKIIEEYRLSLGLVFAYTCMSGIAMFASRGWIYSGLPLTEIMSYKANTGYTTICFALLVLFLFLYNSYLYTFEKAIVHFTWLSMVYTFVRWWLMKFNLQSMGGTFGNPSVNLSYLVFAMPVFLNYYKHTDHREFRLLPRWQGCVYIVGLLTLLFFAQKIVPIVAFVGVVLAYDVAKERRMPWITLGLLSAPICLYLAIKGIPLDSHGRAKVWMWAMEYWNKHDEVINGLRQVAPIPKLFGSGNGTAPIMVPMIQEHHNDKEGYFIWMHSDIIQCLFEMGFVGLSLYIFLTIDCLVRLFNRPYLFASAIGVLVAMSANYPMRMAFQAFFVTWLVFVALEPYVFKTPFKYRE